MARGHEYKIELDAAEVGRALEAFTPNKIARSVLIAFRQGVLRMVRNVTKTKMRGAYINRITGTAIRSVTASRFDSISETEVIAGYGTNLGYLRALELGFRGSVQVRSHTRRILRTTGVSRRAAARAKRRLKKRHKRSTTVRAHTRRVNIRARHFFRDTLAEERLKIGAMTLRALRILARTGRLPKVAEVRGDA